MSTAKKKRRRSSLAAAKIRLDLSPGLGKGLHQQIDQTLLPKERLEQLAKVCLKWSVDKVIADTESSDVKAHLETVLNDVPQVFDQPDVKEAIHHACHREQLLPNPVNIKMDETIKEMEARKTKLKQEEEEWIALFKELDMQTEETERRASEKFILASEMTDTQRELAKMYLPKCSDLSVIREAEANAIKKAKIHVCEHERNLHTLSQIADMINNRLNSKHKQLNEKCYGHFGSPKRTIQNILAFPTPPSEPAV